MQVRGNDNRLDECLKHLFVLQDLPFDISVCVFVLEQALSVRALQEMVSAKATKNVSPRARTQGSNLAWDHGP